MRSPLPLSVRRRKPERWRISVLTTSWALYLAAEHEEIDGPEDSEPTRVGKLEIDQAGHGRPTFTVPDINPGTYVAYLHCQDCSFDAQGLSFAAAGDSVALDEHDYLLYRLWWMLHSVYRALDGGELDAPGGSAENWPI